MTTRSKRHRGIDRRSPFARRHRELVEAYTEDLGRGGLTAAEQSLVDLAATIALKAEQLQAALLNGEAVEVNDLVRLSNSARRIMVDLGLKKRDRKPAYIPLRERLAMGIEPIAGCDQL